MPFRPSEAEKCRSPSLPLDSPFSFGLNFDSVWNSRAAEDQASTRTASTKLSHGFPSAAEPRFQAEVQDYLRDAWQEAVAEQLPPPGEQVEDVMARCAAAASAQRAGHRSDAVGAKTLAAQLDVEAAIQRCAAVVGTRRAEAALARGPTTGAEDATAAELEAQKAAHEAQARSVAAQLDAQCAEALQGQALAEARAAALEAQLIAEQARGRSLSEELEAERGEAAQGAARAEERLAALAAVARASAKINAQNEAALRRAEERAALAEERAAAAEQRAAWAEAQLARVKGSALASVAAC